MTRRVRQLLCIAATLGAVASIAACSSDSGGQPGPPTTSPPGTTVKLLTHSAFAVSQDVLDEFTKQTGYKVKVLRQDDAGAMVNQAILTRDNPQADALYGVDNTFLSRALDAKLFDYRKYAGLDALRPDARDAFPDTNHVVPVDYGDVCFNYDTAWFRARDRQPPTSLDDLADPQFKGLTVVENAATSSPGLAMLLSTIERDGEDNAMDFWRTLVHDNDAKVVDNWTTAYEGDFTAGGGNGKRPIVLSYASSPPADIVYSEGKKTTSDIGVLTDGCFRQYEFAGVLHKAAHPDAAERLVEFMLSKRFQEDMPLQMFVFPTRADATLPAVFTRWAKVPEKPLLPNYTTIGEHREQWIEEWTKAALG